MIGLIPARRGSKRVPGKAMKPVNGLPLLWYTLQAAELSDLKKYYLTSDYSPDELGDLSHFKKLTLIQRPKDLCQDESPASDYIEHAIDYIVNDGCKFTSVCLLQPTCPLRRYADINNAMDIYLTGQLPGLVSVFKVPRALLYNDNMTRMFNVNYDKDDYVFVRNSAIYIFDVPTFLSQRSIFANPSHIYEMEMFRSLDINDPFDINICQKLL